MKKTLVFLLISFCVLYANLPIEKTLKEDQGIDIKVIDSVDSGVDGLNITTLEQPDGFRIPVLSSKDGKTVIGIPDLLISGNEKFKDTLQKIYEEITKHNDNIREKSVLEVFKKHNDKVIKLEGKNKSKITYMVVDPNCPYCHQEIQKLGETLENSNVYMLVIGALGMDSVKKAATFYEEIKDKKSQKDKIKLIHEAFEKSYKPKGGVDISKMMIIGRELAQAGVNAVPYIIKK
ncbi:hypothetical protein [Helicobacter cappadocius]|uniref:Disulfide isomerase DsbG N-terminal domain-containing protein n=1 Tax=Helicobacter cappadocius TaxID=3063998 RepID=A0AA90PKJ0_9HELI|nr:MULTISPECIES: hypothetical protein [unclassified Helicobacter]MDO7253266.1 hypothetical protein [Helicobacter sp. faydin-H75]MDP2539190.1 hypothetical protein [Helicobacter sp. faydin-H76]